MPEAIDEYPHASTGAPLWSENYAWTAVDGSGVSLLLHCGRMPYDPHLWRGTVVVYLADGRLAVSRSIGPARSDREPGNGNIELTCERPFEAWRVRFHGAARRTSRAELGAARLVDGDVDVLRIDLAFENLMPVWDVGGLVELGETHHEQAGRYTGTITVGNEEFRLDCTGYRDHTTGPRDLGPFGGHVWANGAFPSGRAFCLFRAFGVDGNVIQENGFVHSDGTITEALPGRLPTLTSATGAPETFELGFAEPPVSPMSGQVLHSVPISLGRPNDFFLGVDPGLPENVMVDCPARYEWDGEVGLGWMERSGPVSRFS